MIVLRLAADEVRDEHVGWIVAHDVRNAAGTKFVLRKGSTIGDDSLEPLHELGPRELHLVRAEGGELHENEAGARLARAVAGPDVDFRGPFASEFTFVAASRGLFRVDEPTLVALNDLDGVTIFTRFDYQPVDGGEDLAGAKVTPLVIPRATIERAEAICRSRPPLRVRRFAPMRVAALVMERVHARARDRFQATLERKLAWYGSELAALRELDGAHSLVDLVRAVLADRPGLIMVAGASSLDPLEPLFGALRELDARIVKHGVPVDPGSLFWMAYLGAVPIFGLASSEMFSHRTVLELVLPRLLAGETLGRQDLVRLGHGGMLRREMAFRFPPYASGEAADT